MHYTFDLISCLIFSATIFILWVQNWRFSKTHRAIYGLVTLTGIYLVGAVYLAFSWHARTGGEILETFYAFDLLYFVVLSLALGFMTLYFADMCTRRVKYPIVIFIIPIIIAIIFIFFNRQTGWMFQYDANGVYHRGPLLWINYVVWISYYVAMISLVIKSRHKLGAKTTVGFLLFFAFEFGLQVYQFFMVNFYIGGIAFTTGVLYLVIAPIFLEQGKDEMTGLYNRRGFINTVQELLHYDTDNEYCMVAIDINNFLNVNERFGFQVGNQVLAHMGDYLSKLFPNTDAISRFNADHFFICCLKDDVVYSLPTISIQELIPDIHEPYTISLFEGIYPITDRNEDVLYMCDRAVFAVQQVKGDYNHQYAFFDETAQERLQKKSYVIQEMTNALKEKKFTVYFQPIIDIKTKKMMSAEALIRWNDERYGMISPDLFIPLFEKNGSVTTLDLFVCKEVCGYINRWKEKGIKNVPISINVSRVDILIENFGDNLERILNDNKLATESIRIELTESAFVRVEEIRDKLQNLRDKGFRILMDDFGSGYSTFNTFANIPFDILKVDMGFMNNLTNSMRGQSVFESIVEMAERIQMPVVAEGVETKEELELLEKIGIRYVQGFVYAKPMPAEEFEKMLVNNN